jgi:MoaA/NifB/PqqE/SkfB family radical SAM enzyme
MILGVELLPTYKCNQRCKYCYPRDSIPQENEISIEDVKIIIDQVNRPLLRPFRLPYFGVIGGEVFLRKDMIDILKLISDTNFCGVSTNGTMLNEEMLKELCKTKLHAIIFSLDGLKDTNDLIRGKGVYEKVTNDIKFLMEQKHRPKIIVNTVIAPENVDEIPEMAKALKIDKLQLGALTSLDHRYTDKKKVVRIQIDSDKIMKLRSINNLRNIKNFTFMPHCSHKEIIEWYSGAFNPKKWYCDYPSRILRVDPYGNVVPCFNIKMGNIRDSSIKEIWNSKKFNDFRKHLKEGLFPECAMCSDLKLK